jgi:hypothetical protein
VRAAYVAERAQVGDLGFEFLPLGSGERLVRLRDRPCSLGRARVRLFQDHAGAHLRLAQDVVVPLVGVLGDLPAVVLRVRHVTVGGLLGFRQHVHRLDVTVLRLDPGISPAFEQPVTQPEDLFLQHGVLVEHPCELVGNPSAEGMDLRLVKTAAAQPGGREGRRPHALGCQLLTVRAGHDSLHP